MWLLILLPIGLLYLCYRLLYTNANTRNGPPTATAEADAYEGESIETDAKDEIWSIANRTANPSDEVEPQPVETEPSRENPAPPVEPLPPYDPTLDLRDYRYPSLDLVNATDDRAGIPDHPTIEANKTLIVGLLKNYDIHLAKITAFPGPAVTLYEIVPAAGVRVSRIKHLEEEMTLGLASSSVRIIAPIPGKGAIGVEVPNGEQRPVGLRSVLASRAYQQSNFDLPIAIGRKTDSEEVIVDLAALPHLLIAGATGQGKSIEMHTILTSLLFKKHPSQLKLVLMDPQKVEMGLYGTIGKHFLAKVPGQEEAIVSHGKYFGGTLAALCVEMDNRYDLLHEAEAPGIKEYNDKFTRRLLDPRKGHQYLPFIVVAIEDFSDLLGLDGPAVEGSTMRLAERGSRVGIHLILSTSRLSPTSFPHRLIAHFPARAVFKLTSKEDSRAVLGEPGADRLLGNGDMLFQWEGLTTRLQGAWIDSSEVERVTGFIGRQSGYPQVYKLPEFVSEQEMESKDFDLADADPLFEEAARLIVSNGLGSTALIQRKMLLGYNRAGRLMDQLEAAGVVGPGMGSKPRDVLIKSVMELDRYLRP
jgi:DNA segregation ATPase FtsK/SpoIIIE, S-DNA-T family